MQDNLSRLLMRSQTCLSSWRRSSTPITATDIVGGSAHTVDRTSSHSLFTSSVLPWTFTSHYHGLRLYSSRQSRSLDSK